MHTSLFLLYRGETEASSSPRFFAEVIQRGNKVLLAALQYQPRQITRHAGPTGRFP